MTKRIFRYDNRSAKPCPRCGHDSLQHRGFPVSTCIECQCAIDWDAEGIFPPDVLKLSR